MTWTCAACGAQFTRFGPAQRHANEAHHGARISVDGRRRPRATFGGEADAHAAANRVFALTGRRYSAYPCQFSTCDAWHIRPCRLRPEDLARPA